MLFLQELQEKTNNDDNQLGQLRCQDQQLLNSCTKAKSFSYKEKKHQESNFKEKEVEFPQSSCRDIQQPSV